MTVRTVRGSVELEEAYKMTLATVIVSYVVAVGVVCCVGCGSCCVWIGGGMMSRGKEK